jgi:hypothetical protein
MEKVADTANLDGHRESEGNLRGTIETIEKLVGTEKVKDKVPFGSKVPVGRGGLYACISTLC